MGEVVHAIQLVHDWWTECSECHGNAKWGEPTHLHGGPHGGGLTCKLDSYLDKTNGCGAVFVGDELAIDARRDFSKPDGGFVSRYQK